MANRVNLGNIMGATGATGAKGEKGDKGDNGLTPFIQNGTWWLGTIDTGVTAKGNEWFTGTTNPTSQGVNGDLFYNTATNDVFKKTSGVWDLIANLQGEQGIQGEKGDTALSVTLGTVTTGEAGTEASVTNSGTNTDLILDFVIPRGAKGEKGEQGADGRTTVSVGGFVVNSLSFNSNPQTQIDSKLNKNLGSFNSGKYLQVGNDGEIQAVLTDAENDVIEGYYFEGEFYEEISHETEIAGVRGKIYIDLSENLQYRYNGTSYVALIANAIDDTTTSQNKTYSSTKIEDKLSLAMGDIVLTTSGNTVSLQAKNINGTDIGTSKTINLPDALVGASFDTTTEELILTLASGGLVKASYASIYKSLQDQIDDLEIKKVNNADFITPEEVDALFD